MWRSSSCKITYSTQSSATKRHNGFSRKELFKCMSKGATVGEFEQRWWCIGQPALLSYPCSVHHSTPYSLFSLGWKHLQCNKTMLPLSCAKSKLLYTNIATVNPLIGQTSKSMTFSCSTACNELSTNDNDNLMFWTSLRYTLLKHTNSKIFNDRQVASDWPDYRCI